MMDGIYQELILSLARNPINKGRPAFFDEEFKTENRVCGDNLIFYLNFDKKGKVINVFWDGDGCALSVSSASLFSEFIKGKSKKDIAKIKPDEILKLLKLKNLSPGRLKCALLPLDSFIRLK